MQAHIHFADQHLSHEYEDEIRAKKHLLLIAFMLLQILESVYFIIFMKITVHGMSRILLNH